MQEDNFPAAEKIITDIEAVFKKDPKMKEFEIIAVSVNENKSPVIIHNNSLGLESWCVRHVFFHSYNRLMDIRQHRWKREDPDKVCRLLTTALLLNPDITTFWNMRREFVLTNYLDSHSELHYTAVVLSRKPKSAEVFSYRKWLLKNLLKDFPADPGLISNEFHVSEIAAERYPNNYHTWNHRIWCLDQFPIDSSRSHNSFVIEWLNSQKWISSHVSDHSGFQYRQHLLQRLISTGAKHLSSIKRYHLSLLQSAENAACAFIQKTNFTLLKEDLTSDVSPLRDRRIDSMTSKQFTFGLLCSELLLNNDLILLYLGHEALWSHRRYLVHTFHNHFIKSSLLDVYDDEDLNFTCDLRHCHKNIDGIPFEKDSKIEDSSDSMKHRLVSFEKLLLANCKKDLQQSKCASKHKVWMENVLKVELF